MAVVPERNHVSGGFGEGRRSLGFVGLPERWVCRR